LSNLISILPDK